MLQNYFLSFVTRFPSPALLTTITLLPAGSDAFVGVGLGSCETLLHFCASPADGDRAPHYVGTGPFSMFIDFSAVYLNKRNHHNAAHDAGHGSTAEVKGFVEGRDKGRVAIIWRWLANLLIKSRVRYQLNRVNPSEYPPKHQHHTQVYGIEELMMDPPPIFNRSFYFPVRVASEALPDDHIYVRLLSRRQHRISVHAMMCALVLRR